MQPYVEKLKKLRLDLVRRGPGVPKAILTKGGQGGPRANLSQIVYASALRTGQLQGLGQETITAKIQSGDFLPDQLGGISTKTILAALVVLCFLRR